MLFKWMLISSRVVQNIFRRPYCDKWKFRFCEFDDVVRCGKPVKWWWKINADSFHLCHFSLFIFSHFLFGFSFSLVGSIRFYVFNFIWITYDHVSLFVHCLVWFVSAQCERTQMNESEAASRNVREWKSGKKYKCHVIYSFLYFSVDLSFSVSFCALIFWFSFHCCKCFAICYCFRPKLLH